MRTLKHHACTLGSETAATVLHLPVSHLDHLPNLFGYPLYPVLYTTATLRPVYGPVCLLWPQQTAKGWYHCMHLPGTILELRMHRAGGRGPGLSLALFMWLQPTQPQVWLPVLYDPHSVSDSRSNLHYASRLVTSGRTQGVIRVGLDSSVESGGFWLGPPSLSLLRVPLPSIFKDPPHSAASISAWHSAILRL